MKNNELVLICCSGGLDSSCSAAILKLAGYENIIAIHYRYGSRSSDAEEFAITNVCKELNIPLKIFNLENVYKEMDVESISMLSNKNSKIITGTQNGLKTTAAWCPGRNMLFMTLMMILGETEIMKHNYEKVYFSGGFLQLTESATYPDNTPYFVNACLNLGKYGTLIGNRFEILYGLANLMKFEQFVLIKEFNLFNIYRHTISCDRAKLIYNQNDSNDDYVKKPMIACNCQKDGVPACGSGLLSQWAASIVGLDDMSLRNFYVVDDPGYNAYIPEHMKQGFVKNPDINDIINRILLPEDKLDNLRKQLLTGRLNNENK